MNTWHLLSLIAPVALLVIGWLLLKHAPEKAAEMVVATPAKEVPRDEGGSNNSK